MDVAKPRKPDEGRRRPFLKALGPGLIAGAADYDPSGIGTHSQIGAEFGYGLAWTFVLSFPLMVVIQEVAATIGRVTGVGIARNLKRHYPKMLWSMVALLLVANVVNLGADLSAMGAALALLVGGNVGLYTLLFGILCIGLEVGLSYPRYASVLKWATLSLFTYVGVVMVANVPWPRALRSLVVPELQWNIAYATALVAILGTTISPHLFFWQAGQEIEEQRRHHVKPLCITPSKAGPELKRIRLDTLIGMAFSSIISLAIVFATAATLNANGIHDITSSQQAAEALRPLAGQFAFAMFAVGIIGTGLLAVPVLAGSAAYAVTEMAGLPGTPRCQTPQGAAVLRNHRRYHLGGGIAERGRHRSGARALLGGGGQRHSRRAVDGGDDADRKQSARNGSADSVEAHQSARLDSHGGDVRGVSAVPRLRDFVLGLSCWKVGFPSPLLTSTS